MPFHAIAPGTAGFFTVMSVLTVRMLITCCLYFVCFEQCTHHNDCLQGQVQLLREKVNLATSKAWALRTADKV